MASCSGKPFVRSDSNVSSKCAASSACTSSFSEASRARPHSRCLTSFCQSGIGHLPKLAQSAEEFCAFLAQRRKLFLPGRRQPVASAPSAVAARFPASANPPALLHAVEHGVKSGKREAQCALGLFLDAAGHFIAVERALFENAENRQFRGAALDSCSNHKALPYI